MMRQMNYAPAVLVLVLVFSTVYWFAAGKKFYTGPRTEDPLPGHHPPPVEPVLGKGPFPA